MGGEVSAGERDFEWAARNADRERSAGIARIQAAARGQIGFDEQISPTVCDCGEPISEARRAAVPGTRQCVDCATFNERLRRRRA